MGTSKNVDVKYIGPYGEVLVDPDGLGEVSVVFEETISVPEKMAAALLLQPANWTLPTPSAPLPTPPAAKEATE